MPGLWMDSEPTEVPESTTQAAVINLPRAAVAGELLFIAAVCTVTCSTPAGWTLVQSAVGGSGVYVWTKVAAGGETSASTNRTASSGNYGALKAEAFIFGATTAVVASRNQPGAQKSGVPATALTPIPGSDNLLIHIAAYDSNASTPPVSTAAWSGAEVTHVWGGVAGPAVGSTALLMGYLEDSDLTSWGPTVLLGDGGVFSGSDRITVALSVAQGAEPEPPTPLGTPTVTITAENDPTTIGGTNGSIQGTIGSIDPNADRVELGIATGHGQTTGFVTVNADAPTPFTITGRGAGNYTVGVRAHPAS